MIRLARGAWMAGVFALMAAPVVRAADGIRIEHDPGGSVMDTVDQPSTYGLKITAPWKDGGFIMLNLPEHLTYKSNDQAILRWGDNRQPGGMENPWKLSADGREATMDVESPHIRGVRVVGKVKAVGDDRVSVSMKIVNGRDFKLDTLRSLYCTHYRLLTGFPSWGAGLPHSHVRVDGKWTALSDLPTKNPKTEVKWARVKGRTTAPKEFVTSRGGVIDKELDAAASVVTALDGKRKIAIAWKPGGTMLANAGIPCIHADPFYEDIPAGESREAEGIILFTEKPLDDILAEFEKAGFVGKAEAPGAKPDPAAKPE